MQRFHMQHHNQTPQIKMPRVWCCYVPFIPCPPALCLQLSFWDPLQDILFIAELSFQKSVLIKIFFYLQLGRSTQIRPKHLLFPFHQEIFTECNWITTKGLKFPSLGADINRWKCWSILQLSLHYRAQNHTTVHVSRKSKAATWTQNSVFPQFSLYTYHYSFQN